MCIVLECRFSLYLCGFVGAGKYFHMKIKVGDFMTKKRAGQTGGSVSAAAEMSIPCGFLSATNYSASLQDVQEEVSDRFQPKKAESELLASVYHRLRLHGRAARVEQCGSFLEFSILQDGSRKLSKANFCRDRLCSMCNWRRSLKLFSQVSRVMDELEKQGYQFIFLTLTVRNCLFDQLPETVQTLLDGWRFMYHKAPAFRRAVEGSFRNLEITVNNGAGTYHPHLHLVLAVKPTYFVSRDYLSQRAWSDLWRSCCDLDYNPIVFIEKVTKYSEGFKEICKYNVKGSDFLVGSPRMMEEHVRNFLAGLSGRRLCGFTGCFSQVRKALALDDIENGDLLVVDGEELRSDLVQMIVRYSWRCGVYVRE